MVTNSKVIWQNVFKHARVMVIVAGSDLPEHACNRLSAFGIVQ